MKQNEIRKEKKTEIQPRKSKRKTTLADKNQTRMFNVPWSIEWGKKKRRLTTEKTTRPQIYTIEITNATNALMIQFIHLVNMISYQLGSWKLNCKVGNQVLP